jgi:hypothetical protein
MLVGLAAAAPAVRAEVAVTTSVLATGLKSPVKLIVTPGHNILVSESGDAPPNFVAHQGRVSIVDQGGGVRTLLGGLPAGLDLDNTNPAGPSALLLQGPQVLYVVIGAGDTNKRNATNQEVPNPTGPSSALFSSLWRIIFSESVDTLSEGFVLSPAIDYPTLVDGKDLILTNGAGESALIQVVSDFRDITPGPNLINASNPFGMLMAGGKVFLPDAGQNALVSSDVLTGRIRTITHFPSVPNTLPFGPPLSQAVPNSIRQLDLFGRYALVTVFSGFPFGPGASSVRVVDLQTGMQQPFIGGLTMAIDSIPFGGRAGPVLVLEHATSFIPPGPGGPAQFVAPGRLLLFATPTSTPEVLVDTLVSPSSMAFDYQTHQLFVTEIRTGKIIRVAF